MTGLAVPAAGRTGLRRVGPVAFRGDAPDRALLSFQRPQTGLAEGFSPRRGSASKATA
jgi:hypothetical protein